MAVADAARLSRPNPLGCAPQNKGTSPTTVRFVSFPGLMRFDTHWLTPSTEHRAHEAIHRLRKLYSRYFSWGSRKTTRKGKKKSTNVSSHKETTCGRDHSQKAEFLQPGECSARQQESSPWAHEPRECPGDDGQENCPSWARRHISIRLTSCAWKPRGDAADGVQEGRIQYHA